MRWPSLGKDYSPTDYISWLEEYEVRRKAGLDVRKMKPRSQRGSFQRTSLVMVLVTLRISRDQRYFLRVTWCAS